MKKRDPLIAIPRSLIEELLDTAGSNISSYRDTKDTRWRVQMIISDVRNEVEPQMYHWLALVAVTLIFVAGAGVGYAMRAFYPMCVCTGVAIICALRVVFYKEPE